MTLMPHPLSSVNDDVTAFFESLGYTVTWDFSRRLNISWYEILEGDKMIAQIDMGIPLEALREDMTAWHEGRKETSGAPGEVVIGTDPNSPNFKDLFRRVAEVSA